MALVNNSTTFQSIEINNKKYYYYNINKAAEILNKDISRLPYCLKILFENLLRNKDDKNITNEHLTILASWAENKISGHEICYYPSRVLMQDFTGVPAVVDLAAMRDAMRDLGGDANKINPIAPVDLVIDHSVQVDFAGSKDALDKNVALEMERNNERYEFLKWGQKTFNNFRVVPPGAGICHQVNLEYLARVIWSREINGKIVAYPDTVVGTDSHTTMINGLAVLGWGVGGIEAEAAMLGKAVSMLIPEVIGFKLTGKLALGVTATDLVLTITNILRKKGVVNKFVEFFGNGLDHLSLANRATIANMAPEYGATCGFFPIDYETINYLKLTGRDAELISLVENYAKAQGMFRDHNAPDPEFTSFVELDLSNIKPSVAGPKRPQDLVPLAKVRESFTDSFSNIITKRDLPVNQGDIVIAAITSCTNTSNPEVMIGAGLLAKKAVEKGLISKPWVKASLAPGSQVVSEYLKQSNLQQYFDKLGFHIVGYGCTTCIGNSGPLAKEIEDCIINNELIVAGILSGNRNFEGRVHPLVKANYLASPLLVVAYAIAGTININLEKDAIAQDQSGGNIYLKDIWPSQDEIMEYVQNNVKPSMFIEKYKNVFSGDENWQNIKIVESLNYAWNSSSTYINNPPYFKNMKNDTKSLDNIMGAKLLAMFGDSITTDHISPAGNISKSSPAAKYLTDHQVSVAEFNSYGARRGNHEVMMRGTFANIRIKNELLSGTEGGITKYFPTEEIMSIYDAAIKYQKDGINLIIIAGKEYGTGSSRDWAAKGTYLLGVKAVIAESFERIHRSNLIGMGVLPLTFKNNITRTELNLKGNETFNILGLDRQIKPLMDLEMIIQSDQDKRKIPLLCRIDTEEEVEYLQHGGILHRVIRSLLH